MPQITQAAEERSGTAERRRTPRIPFKATSVVAETGSARVVIAQTTELSRFGCFVQTIKPYPKGTRVHIEVAEAGITFAAAGVVAYVNGDGMGLVFTTVPADQYETLAGWLSRTPRRFERHEFTAAAEVKELGSRQEQVLLTRDLGRGGCFLTTPHPLPPGSRIRLQIEHAAAEFTAVARVTHVTAEGMGVEFIEVEEKHRTILDEWLRARQLSPLAK